jgi:dihydrofolate reductase
MEDMGPGQDKPLRLIVAVERNWGIGLQGKLLFRIREDMKRIKALTTGHVIVVGRKTLHSFPGGQPLPERVNIILTRQAGFTAGSAVVAHNLAELDAELKKYARDEIFVLGGSDIYNLLLSYCGLAYVTKVDLDLTADRFFPELDHLPGWRLVEASEPRRLSGYVDGESETREMTCQFCLYRQISPAPLDTFELTRQSPTLSSLDVPDLNRSNGDR